MVQCLPTIGQWNFFMRSTPSFDHFPPESIQLSEIPSNDEQIGLDIESEADIEREFGIKLVPTAYAKQALTPRVKHEVSNPSVIITMMLSDKKQRISASRSPSFFLKRDTHLDLSPIEEKKSFRPQIEIL